MRDLRFLRQRKQKLSLLDNMKAYGTQRHNSTHSTQHSSSIPGVNTPNTDWMRSWVTPEQAISCPAGKRSKFFARQALSLHYTHWANTHAMALTTSISLLTMRPCSLVTRLRWNRFPPILTVILPNKCWWISTKLFDNMSKKTEIVLKGFTNTNVNVPLYSV
jgi:hypothetical protein